MPDSVNNSINGPGIHSALKKTYQSKGKAPDGPETSGLRKACADFESIFVNQMMQQMRKTVPENNMFGGGQAEQMYTSMMDSEMAKSISQQRGLGLADVLFRQLKAQLGDE